MATQDTSLRGGGKAESLEEENGGSPTFERAKEQQPHHSVGFWHHKMSKVRKHVILLWIQTGTSTIFRTTLHAAHHLPVLRELTGLGSPHLVGFHHVHTVFVLGRSV